MLRTELSTSSKLISSQSSEGGPALIDVETDGGTPGLTMSQVLCVCVCVCVCVY